MKSADRTVGGTLFNIQKFSVHDGPGIRTAVFLKGCPLNCRWCANPESQLSKVQILWDARLCIRCGRCKKACPAKAVSMAGDRIFIDHTLCTGCGQCTRQCPSQALKAEGEHKTVAQVLDIVLQDRDFYEESGGGITVTGGELLCQREFAQQLLAASKEEGLDTCCETAGFASPQVFDRIMASADHILFDIKHWDDEKHREKTGVSNRLPYSNMQRAIAMGKDVLPRIPVIPGFNDSLSDGTRLAQALIKAKARRCQLLPFHQFGENKYHLLGMAYDYEDVPSLHEEDLEAYRQTFLDQGIHAFF